MIVNEEDPVKARLVDDRISSLLTEANLLIARRVARTGSDYLDLILNGGHFSFLGQSFDILGLQVERADPAGAAPGGAAGGARHRSTR